MIIDGDTAPDPLATALEEIRARESVATPGPWAWRGNTDNGDPYLTSLGRREVAKPDGTVVVHHAGDVLGHIPVEVTRAEALRRGVANPDYMPEPDVPRDPEGTYDKRWDAAMHAAQEAELDGYLTDENGNPRTEPRLAFCTDWLYTDARKLVTFEVAPGAKDREDPRVYRADITGIRHPDAEFIAGAREDVRRLLAAVEAALEVHALTAFHRHTEACPAHYADRDHPECPDCKVIEWTGCDTCRDEYGNPARAGDCKTRRAVARALLGEESPS